MFIDPEAGVNANLLFCAGRRVLVNYGRVVFYLSQQRWVPLLDDLAYLLHPCLDQFIQLLRLVDTERYGFLDDLWFGLLEREHQEVIDTELCVHLEE